MVLPLGRAHDKPKRKMNTKIKNYLQVTLYGLAALGLLDMMGQAVTRGELRIIRSILTFLF